MSFTPVVTLTAVARDNASFVLTDATPTGSGNGWGTSGAPAGPNSITSIFGRVQPYGDIALPVTQYSGTVATALNFLTAIQDGVNTFSALYGIVQTFTDFLTSPDGTYVTSNDPSLATKMAGVGFISLDGIMYPTAVISVVGNRINLATALPANLSDTSVYIYYVASIQAMTLNNGEALCVNGIAQMPLESDSCDSVDAIIQNIILKWGAEIAFNCGQISKAHDAARLLSGGTPIITNPCTTC